MVEGETGVGVGAVVVPGPAVEAVLLEVGDVVGGEVVAEVVALVDGDPDAAGGVEGEAYGVAGAGGVDALEDAGGGVGEDVGAMEFAGVGVGVGDVAGGAYAYEEARGWLGGEDEGAGAVAVGGDAGGEDGGGGGGGGVAEGVGEAEDGGLIADVEVLGRGGGGVEGEAVGLVEAGGEGGLADGGSVCVDSVEDGDEAGALLGEEDVSVGGGEEIAGVGEAAGVEGDFGNPGEPWVSGQAGGRRGWSSCRRRGWRRGRGDRQR